MTSLCLTKLTSGAKDKQGRDTPMNFVDYHTGKIHTYQLRDTALPCRVVVGGGLLANVTSSGWVRQSD